MSLVHTGKLLIRFIKDFSSIIMEPQQIPKPVIHKDFYMWFGVLPHDDKKSDIIKLKSGPCEIKNRNDEQFKKKRPIKVPLHEIAESEEIETMPTWWHP